MDLDVYHRLRALAGRYLTWRDHGHTLQRTALVHEAYLRMVKSRVAPESQASFFACAARAMRSALVDHMRRKTALKREGSQSRLPLADLPGIAGSEIIDFEGLDRALGHLREIDQRLADIVDLRFFVGLGEEEVANILGISERTVRREWRLARAWLERELSRGEPHAQLGRRQTHLS